MIRNKFRYYIKADATNYYVAMGDAILTTTTRTPIVADPVGWETVEIKWQRNSKYHGIFRTHAIPATFCKDAARILRRIFLTQGYNGAAILEVEMIDRHTREYHPFYSSGIDFKEYVANDNVVQIALLDGGLPALLKAKESTPYSIPLLEANSLKVFMDGVKLQNHVHYSVNGDMTGGSSFEGQFAPDLAVLSSDATYLADVKQEVTSQSGGLAFLLGACFVYTASRAGNVTVGFKGQVEMHRTFGMSGSAGKLTVAAVYNGSLGQVLYKFKENPATTSILDLMTVPYTQKTIAMLPGETLTLIVGSQTFTNTSAPSSNAWQFKVVPGTAEFDIAFDLKLPDTDHFAKRQYQVWQTLMSQMSANQYGVISNYLTNTSLRNWGNSPYNTLLTSGDAARGIGDGGANPALLKVTLNDLHADASCRDNLGVGIEGDNIRVEPLDHFYDNSTVSFDLGAEVGIVSNFKCSINQEVIYNLLKIGYVYNENDTLNGKQDPHTTFQYGTDAKNLNKENNRVSPFVASMYSWENKRSNLKNTSKDDAGDSSVMIVEVSGSVDSSGRQLLYRPQNTNFLSGILAGDTAFNLTLMPEYNLRRNGALLHTGVHLMDGTNLTFQQADQNKSVVSKLEPGLPTVTASANIPISSLPAPLFLPIPFEFDTPVPVDFKNRIEANPYGRINFLIRNPRTGRIVSLGGFADDVNIKPGRNMVCQWKLWACPDTNLADLDF